MPGENERFFLQVASRRLQSAEKIDMRFFLALPGLKSGARHWCFRTGQEKACFVENNVPGGLALILATASRAPSAGGWPA